MRRYIEELWNQRKWHVIDEIIDPGYRSARPSFPGESGIEDLKKNCPPFMAMFPDGKWSTLDMVAEGDKVACAWEFNATHTKDGMGIREVAEALRLRRRGEADDRSLPCRAIAGSPIIGTTPHP